MMKKKNVSDWTYLPKHLLEDVLDRFIQVSDYVQFSVVCKRWLSTAQFHHNQWRIKSLSSPEKQMPMLFFHDCGSVKNLHLCSVVVGKHKLIINKAFNLHVHDYLYEDINIRRCGSSQGWLIFIRKDTFALILYNPFTKSTINFPPIFDVPKEGSDWFKMAVLSKDPSLYPDTYQALVLYNLDFIWLFRSGNDSWVRVKKPQLPDDIRLISRHCNPHAIYYRGKFYIAGRRFLIIVETNNNECCAPRATCRYLRFQQLSNIAQTGGTIQQQYLAESCNGCLLYIERFCDDVKMYEVYLNHEGGPMCSVLLSLGGETLILGLNYSFSLLGSCQPDCIYFADNHSYYTCVYDVRRGHTKLLSPSMMAAVSWIVPQANLNTSYSLVAD